ncbi:MAG: cyclic nucleotide-binding/CBS domain-containing protein [Haloarculaceae archaeon]
MNGDVTVQEMMDREYVGVSESDALLDTCEVMLREGAESVVVLRGSHPVGVMTERDVLAHLVDGGEPSRATVGDVMSESVPTVDPDRPLSAAADEMSAQSTKRLVVTDGDEPVGVITEHDVVTTASLGPELEERPDADTGLNIHTQQSNVNADSGAVTQKPADRETGYEDQGICEVCGTLSRDLSAFNGQLLCADCRDI